MSGRVYLVGAGPGDPGLMTVRAVELIAHADVILHDRLIPAGALDGARPEAIVVDVGKRGGGASTPQAETEALLLEHARAGRTVVRLKGGDPYVFGRGGEEALALRAASIEFEVVPGVTAGVAAGAYAGIPVTQRGRASAVAFVTGHEDPDKPDTALDWGALAAFPGTLVFYMGVRELERITAALIDAGRPATEPAAIVQRGTWPDQRVVTATLASLAASARRAQIGAPAVTIVGSVVELAGELAWFARGPLAGRTVAVMRARPQGSELAERLEALGATVIQAPVIRVVERPGPAPDPSLYDLVCLTSPNGVRLLFERLRDAGRDARSLAGARVAAIGPGTAQALGAEGIAADVVPERSVAEGLVEALGEVPGARALIARGAGGRDVVPDALRALGAEVEVLELYETVAEPLSAAVIGRVRAADYVTFTSASTVRFFSEAAGGSPGLSADTRIASIGPVTSTALRERGMEVHLEAARHDIDGLVEVLVGDAGTR